MRRALLFVVTVLLSVTVFLLPSADMHKSADVNPQTDCQPDLRALCERIDRGIRLVKDARVQAGSTQLYSSLKQSLRPVLDRIREELCDNSPAQGKVDELIKKLNSLRFVPGQANFVNNRLLAQLEDGLKELAGSKCDKRADKS